VRHEFSGGYRRFNQPADTHLAASQVRQHAWQDFPRVDCRQRLPTARRAWYDSATWRQPLRKFCQELHRHVGHIHSQQENVWRYRSAQQGSKATQWTLVWHGVQYDAHASCTVCRTGPT
jgi:hypothetical protein